MSGQRRVFTVRFEGWWVEPYLYLKGNVIQSGFDRCRWELVWLYSKHQCFKFAADSYRKPLERTQR